MRSPKASPSDDAVPAACPNCGAERVGDFCQRCGQHYLDERLTLRGLWREASARVFTLDRGLLHTLAELARSPGRVPADYVAGRRRRYTHPVSFYLLMATVYLVSGQFYQEQMVEMARSPTVVTYDADATPPPDSTASALTPGDPDLNRLANVLRTLDGDGDGIARQTLAIQRRIGTPMLVFFALFLVLPLRLVFGGRRNLAETAVFSLYVVGFSTLTVAVVSPLAVFGLPPTPGSIVLSLTAIGAYAGLVAWAATRFWRPGWRTVSKAGVAGLLAYVVYGIVSGFVALVILLDGALTEAGMGWGDLLRL